MKYFKSLGLCLVAMFALGAVTASSAFAEEPPTFLFKGHPARAFSSKQFGEGTLETTKGETVKCTGGTNTGTFENEKRARDVLISFTGCKAKILTTTYECKSAGANTEEIRSKDLLGRLGWISKANSEVGILFNSEEASGLFAEFTCTHSSTNVEIKVRGSVIALVKNTNELIDPGSYFLIDFDKGTEPGELGKDRKLEGEAENKLETYTGIAKSFIGSAIEGSARIYPLESMEIST